MATKIIYGRHPDEPQPPVIAMELRRRGHETVDAQGREDLRYLRQFKSDHLVDVHGPKNPDVVVDLYIYRRKRKRKDRLMAELFKSKLFDTILIEHERGIYKYQLVDGNRYEFEKIKHWSNPRTLAAMRRHGLDERYFAIEVYTANKSPSRRDIKEVADRIDAFIDIMERASTSSV